MKQYSTRELEKFIKKEYAQLESITENDEIYVDIQVIFSSNRSIMHEGELVYSDELGYHYLGYERGIMQMHRITNDLQEIAYWIFSTPTFIMAANYEFRHRIENQDTRKIIFKKQLELLKTLGEYYYKKGEEDINKILNCHPYTIT